MMVLSELLRSLGIHFITEGNHHCTPGWIQTHCAWCSPSSGYRMGLRGFTASCWQCGTHRLIDAIHRISKVPYPQLYKLIKGVKSERAAFKLKETGTLEIPKNLIPFNKSHKQYLSRRGFNLTTLVTIWGVSLGFDELGKHLAYRIFIPIYYEGEIVSWTTRSIQKNAKVRYWTAKPMQEAIHHKSLLYGEDYARHTIIIVEGPTDAWAIGPGAVATMGLSTTAEQLQRMSKYLNRVVCFDNEPQAQKRAQTLVDNLSIFEGDTYNVTLKGKDAASSSPEEIAALRSRFLNFN